MAMPDNLPITREELRQLRDLVDLIAELYDNINMLHSVDPNKRGDIINAALTKVSVIMSHVMDHMPVIVKNGRLIAAFRLKIGELVETGLLTQEDANVSLDKLKE